MFDRAAFDRFLAEEGRLYSELESLDRADARSYARKISVVLELRRLSDDADRGDLVVCEIATTLRVSEHHARLLLTVADACVRHPDTFGLLREGRLRVPQLLATLDALGAVTADRAVEVEGLALEAGLEDRTPAEIRTLIRRLAIRLDAREAQRRRERAVADRKVAIFPGEDGVGTLWALLPAETLVRVDRMLTEMAIVANRLHPADPRNRDQWRADLLAAAVLSQVPADVRAKTPAVQATVEIPVTVAADLADAPAHLDGFGPIDPAHARLLLPDADLRAAYVDARTGEHYTSADTTVRAPGNRTSARDDDTIDALHAVLLDLASRPHLDDDTPEPGYRPSRKLAARVRRRDRSCTFPGCHCGSRDCDLDHLIPWPTGPTSARNLGPKSRRHHRAKQAGWRSRKARDGAIIWTSPSGRTYRRPPAHQPPPPLRPRNTAREPQPDSPAAPPTPPPNADPYSGPPPF